MEKQDNFYELVYAVAARVPEGMVTTYGDIARKIGRPRCARTVGYAMSNVPENLNIPAHRVVNRLGAMAPEYVFGGKAYQRFLLEKEGVVFTPEGTVDMKRHRWEIEL